MTGRASCERSPSIDGDPVCTLGLELKYAGSPIPMAATETKVESGPAEGDAGTRAPTPARL